MSDKNQDIQLLGIIGEGVNSCVYKGIRSSKQLGLTVPLAVKILKSQTNIELLRDECEKLLRVRSRHCVAFYGWQIIQDKPALLLEYIDGVTLQEFWKSGLSTQEMILEILVQAFQGAKDLSQYGLAHGDLNLTNIMIDREGVVRIIDFGFCSNGISHVTPEFSSASVLMGESPDLNSDLVSLEKIRKFLIRKPTKQNIFEMKSDPKRVHEIANTIELIRQRKMGVPKTCAVRMEGQNHVSRRKKNSYFRPVASIFLVVGICFNISSDSKASRMTPAAIIEIRTSFWVQIHINETNMGYAPRDIRIPPGEIKISWESARGSGNKIIRVKQPKLRLRDDFFIK